MGGVPNFNWNSLWNFIMGRFKQFIYMGFIICSNKFWNTWSFVDDYLKIKHNNSQAYLLLVKINFSNSFL